MMKIEQEASSPTAITGVDTWRNFENTVTVGEKFDNKAVGIKHFQYPINKIKSEHGGSMLII